MSDMTYYVELKGKKYLVTNQNQLTNRELWDDTIRDWLAEKENLELGEEHIAAVDFIRKTYERRKQHPMPRVIASDLAKRYGADKGNMRYFYSLFPRGVQQAVTIAGLPLQGLCF
jgi:tRNA 2-thiouridine synthesizing protein E